MLVNKEKLMGDFRNVAWQNAVAVATSIVMIGLTGMLVWNTIKS
jgi:Mn2+/Fe2+ NRAMP family transporter